MSSRGRLPYPRNLIWDTWDGNYTEKIYDLMRCNLDEDRKKGLDHALKLVGGREEKMLRMYYIDGKTYQKIGDECGLTRERIRVIIKTGMRMLRSPKRWGYVQYGYTGMESRKKAIRLQGAQDITRDSDFYNLELSVRASNCLRRAGAKTIGDVIGMSTSDLIKIKNLGDKSLFEIQNAVNKFLQNEARSA